MRKPRAPRPSRSKKPPLPLVCQMLIDQGHIESATIADEKLVLCTIGPGWRPLAREASAQFGGTWFAMGQAVRWHYGRESVYFLPPERERHLRPARELTLKYTGTLPGWGFGACARAWLAWAIREEKPSQRDALIEIKDKIGYRQVNPGSYPEGCYHDLDANYFNLMKRLKTPFAGIDARGQLDFFPYLDGEAKRWQTLLEVLTPEKRIRNAVWGAMLGSTQMREKWRLGALEWDKPYNGHNRATAALIGRSAWEICREECERSGAMWAHTDAVILPGRSVPRYWEALDLDYKSPYVGQTRIIHEQNWKVGAHPSVYWEPKSQMEDFKPLLPAPARQFHLEWMRAYC